MLPSHAYHRLTADLTICRLLNGLWQVSGAHGRIEPNAALRNMLDYHDAGFTTWDLADHYGPAEDLIGSFRRELVHRDGSSALQHMQAFTKWVPRPGRMTRQVVEAAIDISRRRMQVDTIDLLQFHWWDYADRNYLDALKHLADLQQEGKIRHLALTNFDTERLRLITEAGIRIVSNQVQYSIVDQRPAARMAAFCQQHGIALLTYGTLGGGLFSEAYLGQPEPSPASLATASLRKYKNMIEAWGGWSLFQELLRVLKAIADRHGSTIPLVATRFILDQPTVAGVIVGVRLGLRDHHNENARVFDLHLTTEDTAAIAAVTARARDLMRVIGDCGDEYRR